MARNVYRVTPEGDQWKVKKDGADRADSLHKTKESAVERAREVAKNNQPSQVVVHLQNGRIETEWTYGDDPFPPSG